METPPPPPVFWKHLLYRDEIPLTPRGALSSEPAASLADALEDVSSRRKDAAARDGVFIIIRRAAGGWWVYEYREDRIGSVQLNELAAHDLPLGADPDNPQTYVVDASGALGKVDINNGNVIIRRLAPLAEAAAAHAGEPALARDAVDGFVVSRELVNHGRNMRWTPKYTFRPGLPIETLASGLAWMSQQLDVTIPIRAAGSRHSWSPIARSPGVSVMPQGWAGIAPLAPGEAAAGAEDPNAIFRVHAGTRIRELNATLQKLGRAMPYLGGFDGQTAGGVFPTGTHGSVLRFGPLADLICSIDLVRFDGTILRIEPARAPVCDAQFVDSLRPKRQLCVGDALFDAARVGLGAFGVIHSVALRTATKYWLREVRTETAWADVAARLAGGRILDVFEPRERTLARFANPDAPPAPAAAPAQPLFPGHPAQSYHFELLWNPYTGKTLLTSRHFVGEQKRHELEANEPPFFDKPPIRNILRIIGFDPMADEYSRPDAVEVAADHFGSAAIGMVEFIAEHSPASVPGLIDSAIDGLVDPKGYIQRSYNVFNIGRAANLLPALSATISVPIAGDAWIQAVDIMARVARDKLKAGLVQTAPTSFRYVAKSTAHMADPEDVCKIEIIFGGTSGETRRRANELVAAHYRELRAALGSAVRLHWGQIIPPGTLDTPNAAGEFAVEASYPRYQEWRKLRDSVDPAGRGMTPWLRAILPPART